MPSSPAALQRNAAATKSSRMRLKSQSSICFGKPRCCGSRTTEGATGGNQAPPSHLPRRPGWEIWQNTAAPCRCTACARAAMGGMIRSSAAVNCPNGATASGDTAVEPPIIVNATPPFAFSS